MLPFRDTRRRKEPRSTFARIYLILSIGCQKFSQLAPYGEGPMKNLLLKIDVPYQFRVPKHIRSQSKGVRYTGHSWKISDLVERKCVGILRRFINYSCNPVVIHH